jgi:hypothetical protein
VSGPDQRVVVTAQNVPKEENTMKVRDAMTAGAECVGESETLVEAARKMADLVRSLPDDAAGDLIQALSAGS